ncbi:aminotransferase class I/II-fold pyridoxal phosphate-dependent enzyme [Rhodocaloribacter litoris]|uniref:aminotransferase class I/II-fold pyridoxal phosphate-dependent enzyme n=1 Tax=Rhodocaloribacter litoris TaxID=2558931 RepID=UPI00142092D5|nr:aminotransferase class I/II-fold pyridoxal phosphate-dependent enzyme [Rhodocaloribacter litoris]QXD14785.1 aminotransferase class I/II-fold pyridoxal phosphate-dependent enzyme [Rhodocaloribacter litoris]GIV59129.1 MAG: aminotransferase [Rhodothermaceae bacterium]
MSISTSLDLENRLAERVRRVPPSGIRRFFDIAATMEGVISLGIGEPDFVSPAPIVDAGIASLREGKTGYTSNAGLLELREAIAADLEARYGVSYDPATEILVTVGVSEALQLAMLALLDPGDEILIPEPCFVSYGPTAVFAGGKVVYVPTFAEHDFQVTAADLAARITPRTKVLFLSYPNNPTGAVLRRAVLEEIAEVVVEHDLLVLSDEIYDRLVYGAAYEQGHTCLPSIPALRDRTVLLGGFSKGYAMTGWRIGYVCAPEPVYRAMYKLHQYIIMSAPTMAQYGALAGLRHCQEDVERMRQAYDRRRRLIVDGLRAAGLPTFEPEGAFYCFPDIRSTGLTSEEFAQKLLQEERVAVVPGDAFGPSGAGYVRCSYATALEKIEEAVVRITRFARKYQARHNGG